MHKRNFSLTNLTNSVLGSVHAIMNMKKVKYTGGSKKHGSRSKKHGSRSKKHGSKKHGSKRRYKSMRR
jgi:hypothetical protein